MTRVTIEEAQNRLADLILAAAGGEEVVISGNGQPAVKLVPVPTEKPRPRFGSAKGLIVMADDFDAPLEDFKEYME